MSTIAPLTADQRAALLVKQRDTLLGQLPARLPGARSLGRDTCELIVDEAIEYTSLEHTEPIARIDQLTALFWGACANRVKRAAEGRYDTVRAGWRRDDDSALDTLVAAGADEPLAAALRREERELLAEVLRTLTPRERAVIAVKYMGPSNATLGYKKVARHLALPLGSVRAAERSIREKFDRCATAARAREAALERKLGQLLPVPPAADEARRRFAGWRDVAADWLGRPFAPDSAAAATQVATNGAGRGAGSVLAVKLATLCIGAGGVVGGACVATGALPARDNEEPVTRPATRARPTHTPTSTPTARETELRPARTLATPTPRVERSRGQGGNGPRDHETKPASPAPGNAAPGGESEFDPTYQPNGPTQPAPPPAAPGSGEFF